MGTIILVAICIILVIAITLDTDKKCEVCGKTMDRIPLGLGHEFVEICSHCKSSPDYTLAPPAEPEPTETETRQKIAHMWELIDVLSKLDDEERRSYYNTVGHYIIFNYHSTEDKLKELQAILNDTKQSFNRKF